MGAKFTSGPWAYIKPDGVSVRHPQVYGDTGPICNATWLGDGRLNELEANARLIAAAPDLLQELINIASAKPSTWEDPSEFKAWAQSRAQAAIVKATGE